jgi:PERQ amino acid-rich with GYF domain-containing protein
VPQPGLPSSSTWASGASPVTPGAGNASAWAKPLAGKAPGQPTAAAKKTLQQIQKEEEARKQKAAAQATANAFTASVFTAPTQSLASGKRYADLASKQSAIPPANGGGAWTTVGSSGKAKAPIASPAPPPAVRSASSSVVPAVIKKPVVTRSTTGQAAGQVNAQEEFKKWAVAEVRGDLNKSINGKCPSTFICHCLIENSRGVHCFTTFLPS